MVVFTLMNMVLIVVNIAMGNLRAVPLNIIAAIVCIIAIKGIDARSGM